MNQNMNQCISDENIIDNDSGSFNKIYSSNDHTRNISSSANSRMLCPEKQTNNQKKKITIIFIIFIIRKMINNYFMLAHLDTPHLAIDNG